MSAKKSRRAAPTPVAATPAAAVARPVAAAGPPPAWIDSNDPRKRLFAKILLVAVWIYVAALWLLALDQWFHWGIFGPKIPPVP